MIPHHHRRALLQAALASVIDENVLVVDDSDEGGLVLPGVEVLRSRGRQGFARAANLGLAAAQARGAAQVLLLNDDAAPEPGCLPALRAAFGPGVGAVGPTLVGPDGQVESAGIDLSPWGRLRARRRPPTQAQAAAALSGACLLVSAEERFDVGFSHGMEDLELCARLRRRGLSLVVLPQRCRHVGGATLDRRSPAAQRHAVAGHLRLVGGGAQTPAVLALALAQVIRENGPVERVPAILDGWRDWRRRGLSAGDSLKGA